MLISLRNILRKMISLAATHVINTWKVNPLIYPLRGVARHERARRNSQDASFDRIFCSEDDMGAHLFPPVICSCRRRHLIRLPKVAKAGGGDSRLIANPLFPLSPHHTTHRSPLANNTVGAAFVQRSG